MKDTEERLNRRSWSVKVWRRREEEPAPEELLVAEGFMVPDAEVVVVAFLMYESKPRMILPAREVSFKYLSSSA